MTLKDNLIILASASPRRIEMLTSAGFNPVVKPASIQEHLPFGMDPETATMYLALCKAMAVAEEISELPGDAARDWPPAEQGITIIAADTVVVYDDRIIGKPADRKQALEILRVLRGHSHHVITGCCVIRIDSMCVDLQSAVKTASKRCFFEDTEVFFTDYSDEDLLAYVETDEPYDKAGGYAIQETFGKYIHHIDGDYDNVIGLPITKLKEYL